MAAIMMNGQLYGSSNLPVTDASSINYDNTTTALSSTTVQGAIDESFNTLKSGLTNVNSNLTSLGLSVVNGRLCQTYSV